MLFMLAMTVLHLTTEGREHIKYDKQRSSNEETLASFWEYAIWQYKITKCMLSTDKNTGTIVQVPWA